MKSVAIIPARYNSSRFPGKPLASLNGKPLIQHVYENSLQSSELDRIIVATDNESIFETAQSFGCEAVMTSPELPSGTDRIAEVTNNLDYDIIVNVQGDEPLIRGEMIDNVVRLLDDKRASMGTLVKKITNKEEIFNPHVVKAVFNREGFALYFSRASIPYYRNEFSGSDNRGLNIDNLTFYKHIGLYSYRKEALLDLTGLPRCCRDTQQ